MQPRSCLPWRAVRPCCRPPCGTSSCARSSPACCPRRWSFRPSMRDRGGGFGSFKGFEHPCQRHSFIVRDIACDVMMFVQADDCAQAMRTVRRDPAKPFDNRPVSLEHVADGATYDGRPAATRFGIYVIPRRCVAASFHQPVTVRTGTGHFNLS